MADKTDVSSVQTFHLKSLSLPLREIDEMISDEVILCIHFTCFTTLFVKLKNVRELYFTRIIADVSFNIVRI